MSTTHSDDEKHSPENPYQLIIQYEESILELSGLIDMSLEENLVKSPRTVSRTTIIRSIESIYNIEINDEQTHQLAHSTMSVLSDSASNRIENLTEKGGSKQLLKFFSELANKYGAESRVPGVVEEQGPNYWDNMDYELVKRGWAESIGMNYRIGVGESEEVDLSMDLNSNISMISNMMAIHEFAVNEFGEEAVEQINEGALELLDECYEDMKSAISEHQKEVSKDED